MGSWHKTCGLTSLPIIDGDAVYAVVLVQSPDQSRSYTTAFWQPIALPVTAKYDDYGCFAHACSNFEHVFTALKREMKVTPDVSCPGATQLPTDLTNIDVDQFFISMSECTLVVEQMRYGINGSKVAPFYSLVDFVLLRKDAVDYILDNRVVSMYAGNGKGNSGEHNQYLRYKFADVAAGIPVLIQMLKEGKSIVRPRGPESAQLALKYTYTWSGLSIRQFAYIVDVAEIAEQLVENNDIAQAEKVLHDGLMLLFIDSFMNGTRKQWFPAGHEGSHGQDISEYRLLNAAIDHAIPNIESEDD